MNALRWRAVLVVMLLIILAKGGQAASIVGSYHDLAHIDSVHENYSGAAFANQAYDDYNRVCVYCHTPHNASQQALPLWNRPLSDPASFTLYNSSTMDSSTLGGPSTVSLLCLSCHDGSFAVDTVLNVPNTGVVPQPDGLHGSMTYPRREGYQYVDCASCHQSGFYATYYPDFTPTYFGHDLSSDHPVSMEYSTVDPELVTRPVDGKFANGIKLVDNKVECVSCHDVHDPQYRPFLRLPNTGSAVCYTCHLK